jgi:hypothetical protein
LISSYLSLAETYYCHGRRGRDRMVVGFTTTYAIGVDLRCFFPDKWHDEISKEKHYVRLEMVPSFTLTCNRNRMCMCMRISLSINL